MALFVSDKWGNVEQYSESPSLRSSLDEPADWLLNIGGGSPAASGARVTWRTALGVGAFFKACRLIATDVARAPLHLWTTADGPRRHAYEHPAYKLMMRRTNHYQRAFDFIRQMQFHCELFGNAFAYNYMDDSGRTLELLPFLPGNVQVFTTPGGPIYQATMAYTNGPSKTFWLDQSEMFHLKDISYDGAVGLGTVAMARDVLGQMIATQQYNGRFFANGAIPSTVITHPGRMSEEGREALRNHWINTYSGALNAFKTAVLDEGMKLERFSTTASDSQMNEWWLSSVRDIANYKCMPSSKLGDPAQKGYASIEQLNLEYMQDCLEGALVNFERCADEVLLTTDELDSGEFGFKFCRSELLVADMVSRATATSKAMGNNAAWFTINEARAQDGLNPLPDGDRLPTQGNQPATQAETPEASDGMDGEDAGDGGDASESGDVEGDEVYSVLHATAKERLQRAATKIGNEAKKAYKRAGAGEAMREFASAMNDNMPALDTFSALGTLRKARNGAAESILARFRHEMNDAAMSVMFDSPQTFEARFTEALQVIPGKVMAYANEILS